MRWTELQDPVSYLTAETIQYELQRFNAEIYFSPEVLRRMDVEWVSREAGRDAAMRIMGMVATWRKERLLEVPANWWQHFKQRWFPKWALEKWPVLTRTYDAAVILPKVPVGKPEWHTVEFPVWQAR